MKLEGTKIVVNYFRKFSPKKRNCVEIMSENVWLRNIKSLNTLLIVKIEIPCPQMCLEKLHFMCKNNLLQNKPLFEVNWVQKYETFHIQIPFKW